MKTKPSSAPVLEKVFARERGELTVADAAARAGVPLRDAEESLRYLAAEYGGHLSATSKGEILYSFPKGLQKPPETRLLRRAGRAITRAVVGVGRFIVRAWVSVVLVTYALAFVALLIAMSVRGGSDRDDGPSQALGVVFRVLAEALFWTFHPFSPVYLRYEPDWMHTTRRRTPQIPFYEKVNRFVFGPAKPERDPRAEEQKILAEIRGGKGRITPADVMRVTGLPREDAERLLLRLLVDYDGEIEVSDEGAIVYRFSNLRTTARAGERAMQAAPVWRERVLLPPLTGNTGGANMLFALINGFNLAVSSYVIANGLTVERITEIIGRMGDRFAPPLPPPDGSLPLLFGAIPLAFSLALFALPLMRALRRPSAAKKVADENGWRGLLRLALEDRGDRIELSRDELARAWIAAGGQPPTDRQLRDAVRAAGGDVDLSEDGKLVYKFEQVEREAEAALSGRRAASQEEVSPGEVVFSSADEGSGIREGAEEGERNGKGRAEIAGDGRGERALPEKRETLEDDLLARLGVDTRHRRR